MKDILITIAIPTYNNSATIRETIESCLRQKTEVTYEILIADDASEDSTPEVIKEYNDSRIRIETLKERISLTEIHNFCLKSAKGAYVIFAHADDTLEEHAIEILVKKLKERNYPKKYVVWGHSMFRDFLPHIHRAGFSTNELIVGQYAASIFLYGGLVPSGTCYSKESILELGGFINTNHRLAPFDMVSMIYYATKGFRFEMIDEMILLRTDASTLTTQTKINEILASLDDAFEQYMLLEEENDIRKLLNISTTLKEKPWRFFYALAKENRYKKRIKRILMMELVKNPLLLRDIVVRKLIQRVK
jgi:glycosyltransferase involved in cell wall biosynthesis